MKKKDIKDLSLRSISLALDDAEKAQIYTDSYTPKNFSLICNLSNSSLQKLSIYANLLFHFNKKTDLISPCSPKELISRHIFDSLKAFETLLLYLNGAEDSLKELKLNQDIKQIVDVGSGAGLPGYVWSSLFESQKQFLIEPREKRVLFLKEVLFTLQRNNYSIDNIEIIKDRYAPKLFHPKEKEQFTICVCRALGKRKDFLSNSLETFTNKLLVVEMLGSSAYMAQDELKDQSLSLGYINFELLPYSNSKHTGTRYLGISSI